MRRFVAFALAALIVAPVAQAGAAGKPRLKRFAGCEQLVRYAKAHDEGYKAGGPPDGRMPVFSQPAGGGTASGQPQAAAAPGAAESDSSDQSFSSTNTQEAGVFEPDTVKTNGETLYTVTSNGVLQVVDVSGASPVLRGSLELNAPETYGYGHQMLMFSRLQKLLVSWSDGTGSTVLALIDVSDPAKPVVGRTLTVNGDLLAERRTGGTVRAVLAVRPRAIAEPAQANASNPRAWLPRATLRKTRGVKSSQRKTLVKCRAVRRPRSFSGLESLTVLTIDVEDSGLDPVDSDAVMTGGDTVYSSARNLFVATHRYQPELQGRTDGEVSEKETTQIHRFSLDDKQNTTYRGSGEVPGFLLNQFSFSEAGDVLRVASSQVPPWFDERARSESFVTTLSEEEGGLAPLGQVGGLGKGERIYAVRFLGDVGYVVTFRQVDPLYVVDLSKPAEPRLRGELKIPGYSSYLHPIAGDRLIGVGYGPNEDESEFGLQVSEFDVSDLDDPKLEHRVTVANGSSPVEYDHHAFLWWAPLDLVVLPVIKYEYQTGGPEPQPGTSEPGQPQASSAPEQARGFFGAIGWTVRPAGITEVGKVDHGTAVVTRSLVIGNQLYTVSDAGLKTSTLDTFTETGFAAFPQSTSSGGGGTATADSGGASSPRR